MFPWLVMIGLGSMIAAAQLLPTLEFIGRSVRADLSYRAVSAGLPLNELIAILYPGFFGGSPEYVGVVSLVLIALALVLGWAQLQNQPSPHPLTPAYQTLFWSAAALLSLLLAFGGKTFLYPLFYLLAPGFDSVRQQERAFLIYSFSAAILAGYGALFLAGPLSKPLRQRYIHFERRLRQVGSVVLAMMAVFIYGSAAASARDEAVNLFFGVLHHHIFALIILAGLLIWLALRPRRWVRRPWGMGLVALWLIFNLFTVNWRFNLAPTGGPPLFTPNGSVQFLKDSLPTSQSPNLSPGRIISGGLLPGGNSAASVYALQDLTGNTPLHLATVDAFLRQMPAWRMWQLMNVRYIVDTRDISDEGLVLAFEGDALKVFAMGDPFPRAWFVSQTEVIADDSAALARLAQDTLDLRQAAVIPSALNVTLADPASATVDITTLTPTLLQAKVNATGPHLLIFSQIYYPGWKATVDGAPVPLQRVNVVLSGLVVPPGVHTVQLDFQPSSFWWGGVISLMGLMIWVILLMVRLKLG